MQPLIEPTKFTMADGSPVDLPDNGAFHMLGIDTLTGKVDMVRDLREGAANSSWLKAAVSLVLEDHASQYSETLFAMAAQTEVNRKINKRPFILNNDLAMQLISRCASRLEQAYVRMYGWDGCGRFEVLLPYTVSAVFKNASGEEELDLSKCRPYVNGTFYVALGAMGWDAVAIPGA